MRAVGEACGAESCSSHVSLPPTYPHLPAPQPRSLHPLPPCASARAGMGASVLLADTVYNVSCNVILDSAMRAISSWDVITSMIKCWVFGTIIATGG